MHLARTLEHTDWPSFPPLGHRRAALDLALSKRANLSLRSLFSKRQRRISRLPRQTRRRRDQCIHRRAQRRRRRTRRGTADGSQDSADPSDT